MDSKSAKETISQIAGCVSVAESDKPGYQVEAFFGTEGLQAMARALLDRGFYIECLTAADFEDGQVLYYTFNRFEAPLRVLVRTPIETGGEVPTISHIYSGASWYEREVFEFYDITFSDHGDLRKLLLPEDADFHPLKKTFGKVAFVRTQKAVYGDNLE